MKTQPVYIDPMEEMIAQIRQEERNGARIDFVLQMLRGGESDEKIVQYTRLDIEKIREVRTVWEDIAKGESEMKTRAMYLQHVQLKDFKIEGTDIPRDRKRNLLQMLDIDSGARTDQ